ncbi:MAG: hypothetical protein AAF517_03405 [Planctomycetota bacterium]
MSYSLPAHSQANDLLKRIREDLPSPGLTPNSTSGTDWEAKIAAVGDSDLLGAAASDPQMAEAVRSGLLLRANLLDESHEISQSIHTSTGSYWHGIMHRREGDYSNAKYWFRQVGTHPAYDELAEALGESGWDPFDFVDRCSRSHGRSSDELERIQETEFDVLLSYCLRKATGS